MRLHVLSGLVHLYVGLRILPSLSGSPPAFAALALLLASSAVLIPLGLRARRFRSPRTVTGLTWAGLLSLGLSSSLFVLTVLRDAALAVAGIVDRLAPAALAMEPLAVWSAAAVPLAGALITARGFSNARRTASVVSVAVPIPDLPQALQGLRIAQISDVHVGLTIRRNYVEGIVQAVNALRVDLVAVTGDLVDGSVAELRDQVEPLAGLSSRHGTYFVTGNHDYYSGAHAWIDELRRLGLRVLMNEHVVLRHGESSLVVAGVADWGAHHFDPSHRSDPHAAIAGAPEHASLRLLLAHQPRSARAAADAGFDLQLSGHTHGGQFLPWTFFVRLQQPFTAGLHRLDGLWVYVSRGTGYWGPPKRFGAPSEITVVTLVRQHAGS
jgi:uncharacterized protein